MELKEIDEELQSYEATESANAAASAPRTTKADALIDEAEALLVGGSDAEDPVKKRPRENAKETAVKKIAAVKPLRKSVAKEEDSDKAVKDGSVTSDQNGSAGRVVSSESGNAGTSRCNTIFL